MIKQLIEFIVSTKLVLSPLKDNKIGFMIYNLDTQPKFNHQDLSALISEQGWSLKLFPQTFDQKTGKPVSERIYCGPSKTHGIKEESEVRDFLTSQMS
jgi:hypothetical protein